MSFVWVFFLKFRLHFWCQLCLEIIDCGKKHKLVSCFSVFCRLFFFFFFFLQLGILSLGRNIHAVAQGVKHWWIISCRRLRLTLFMILNFVLDFSF